MQLTLIRHLPTSWNAKGILQGRRNIPLLDISEDDDQDIQNKKQILVESEPFDMVLVSSLVRTHQTAKAYGYTRFTVEPLLDELDFGIFEGKEKKHLIECHKNEWFHNPRDLMFGEKVSDLEGRIIQFIEKYKKHSSILAFGHGSWMRACYSYLTFGAINKMNQVEIKNNQLLLMDVSQSASREEEFDVGRHHI